MLVAVSRGLGRDGAGRVGVGGLLGRISLHGVEVFRVAVGGESWRGGKAGRGQQDDQSKVHGSTCSDIGPLCGRVAGDGRRRQVRDAESAKNETLCHLQNASFVHLPGGAAAGCDDCMAALRKLGRGEGSRTSAARSRPRLDRTRLRRR